MVELVLERQFTCRAMSLKSLGSVTEELAKEEMLFSVLNVPDKKVNVPTCCDARPKFKIEVPTDFLFFLIGLNRAINSTV